MAKARRLSSLFLALLLAFGIAAAALAFEPGTLTIRTQGGELPYRIEIATTPADRSQGLMHRPEIAEDYGMLFIFDDVRPVAMWMRNTLVTLDMLFLGPDGRIMRIATGTTPLSEKIISSDVPVKAVLEIKGGSATARDIKVGDRVLHPLLAGS